MKRWMLALATLAFSSLSFAAPPDGPHITAAVTDIKQLQFDITPVARVNRYELWFRANPDAKWVRYAETSAQSPRFRIRISVHLLDWRAARYYVKACNPSGCGQSNVVGVGVNNNQLAAMGYFKPYSAESYQYFGGSVALSEDGGTMAVLNVETVGAVANVQTIHVYRRDFGQHWRLEARIVPSMQATFEFYHYKFPLSLSQDGNVLAYGHFNESRTDPNSEDGGDIAGAVYVYRRTFDGWRLSQKLVDDDYSPSDEFGQEVALDLTGKTLAITHGQSHGEWHSGIIEVYQDPYDGEDKFVHAATVPSAVDSAPQKNCHGIALSDSGTLLRSCYAYPDPTFTQVLTPSLWGPLEYTETARLPGGANGVAIDAFGERAIVHDGTYPIVYRHDSSGWTKEGTLDLFPLGFYTAVALSADGRVAAVANPGDHHAGRGPLYPPYTDGTGGDGAVVIYERRTSGWQVRRLVKDDSTDGNPHFGDALALAEDGRSLAVGAPYDSSATTGIDGARNDVSSRLRGAVWLY